MVLKENSPIIWLLQFFIIFSKNLHIIQKSVVKLKCHIVAHLFTTKYKVFLKAE